MIDHEFKIESAKAVPALGGAVYAGITLNEMVAIVTIIYVLLQIAYLGWKWNRERKKP